jgi:zinc-ribbon family
MVVIFGFGPGSPEDQGEVAPCACPNCHNQVFLHHIRSKKSVRLYFVPVVPYGTDDYLVCPVCSRGLQISGAQLPHVPAQPAARAGPAAPTPASPLAADDQPWISQLHKLTQLHDQGVLSDAAYADAKRRILRQDNQPPPPGTESPPAG